MTTPIAWWRRPDLGRRAVDVAIVLVCLFLAILAVKARWAPLPRPVIAVAGIAGSLAMAYRRRWPLLTAAAGSAAFALSGNPAPLLVGLASGSFYARRRLAWLAGVFAFAGFFVWSWIDTGRPADQGIIAAAIGFGLVLLFGRYLATRASLLDALQAQAQHEEAERELREEQARAAERTRIAREMHDVLAHKVSLIALHAGALELNAADDARLRDGAQLIRTTARQALQELREVLGILRVGTAGVGGGEPPADLAGLVRESTGAGQVVDLRDGAGDLSPAMARVVYRIVQEGLTNAHKHAPGGRVTVAVDRAIDESVTVFVSNETTPKEASTARAADLPGSGSGLIGLAERIRLVGGTLRSGPNTHDGVRVWELQALVPWLGPS